MPEKRKNTLFSQKRMLFHNLNLLKKGLNFIASPRFCILKYADMMLDSNLVEACVAPHLTFRLMFPHVWPFYTNKTASRLYM